MEWSLELGIKELTVFALSTDNLKRSQLEVDTLMTLAKDSFAKMAEHGGFMEQHGIRVKILGDLDLLPEDVRAALRRAESLTEKHEKATLNVCLCYNSKHEILSAFDQVAESGTATIESFESKLYGGSNCKPEILIRTSNEVRLSNFLLY